MSHQLPPSLPKWPFVVGDALLFGCAYFIFFQSKLPMSPWQIGLLVFCVVCAACLGVLPFLLEYRVLAKLAEAHLAANAVSQIKNLESVAAQIGSASTLCQTTHEHASKTVTTAREISERLSSELKTFSQFIERANDSDRSNLRLEVEKLRRAEADWLQVLVRMLDHVFALHQGAVRTGQPNLITQLSNFQNACRDSARRVGLVPYVPEASEPFDPQRHQVLDNSAPPNPGALISEIVATGYTFQGKMLRPALVRVGAGNGGPEKPSADPIPVQRAQTPSIEENSPRI